MQKEPLAITTAMRFVLNGIVQGLILWEVITLSTEQHAWLTVTFAGVIESVLWLIVRNDVWAPGGQPTHPPTEALWSSKVAATKAEGDAALAALRAELEPRFSDSHSPIVGKHTAPPLSQDTQEALVDSVNPGQEE